mmetsp:Transcript_29308/g.88683  ORF Transcript_29308/g.88683 Transcript_29308/m.88683 type:complete len:222 (+) Transcript_29308:517-1182(+)
MPFSSVGILGAPVAGVRKSCLDGIRSFGLCDDGIRRLKRRREEHESRFHVAAPDLTQRFLHGTLFEARYRHELGHNDVVDNHGRVLLVRLSLPEQLVLRHRLQHIQGLVDVVVRAFECRDGQLLPNAHGRKLQDTVRVHVLAVFGVAELALLFAILRCLLSLRRARANGSSGAVDIALRPSKRSHGLHATGALAQQGRNGFIVHTQSREKDPRSLQVRRST